MSRTGLRAEFIAGTHGRRFVIARHPPGTVRGTVMVVPPFAEEMNKARRMVTEVTQALAAVSIASVAIDLFGTGDSDGEFRDATWADWLEDLALADAWSAAGGLRITSILAIRLGCPLAAAYVRGRSEALERWVFWQPVLEGARYMDQFLRLKLAAGMFDDGAKVTIADLRRQVREQGVLEVAGYELTQKLLTDVDEVRLRSLLDAQSPPLHWIELTRSADAPLPAAAGKVADELTRGGCRVRLQSVVSEPLWTATEIVVVPELARATVAALSDPS